jgi:hypothetical protein
MVRMYRAVTATEYEDIQRANGAFQGSPSIPDLKGFFFDELAAKRFAATATTMYGERHMVVYTDAPEEIVAQGIPHEAANEGKGVYLGVSALKKLTPARLITS